MVFAKLLAHAGCAILLCKYACATKCNGASVPESADAGSERTSTGKYSTSTIPSQWIQFIFDPLYDKCRRLDEKRTDETRLTSFAYNGKLDSADRQQKLQFVLLFVFSSSNPLEQFTELLKEMPYGVMERLYDELTSFHYTGSLAAYLLKNFEMGHAAENALFKKGDECRRDLERLVLAEIRPPTCVMAVETLMERADVNGPLDAFMLLDWQLFQDPDPSKSGFANHLMSILCAVVVREVIIPGSSLYERIEKYIKPLMQMMFVYYSKDAKAVLRCKWAMITCASSIEDDAIFRMFSWREYKKDPKPTAAEFFEHTAIGIDHSLYFVINFIHHCFRREVRNYALPADVNDELANYFIEDVPDTDKPTRLELFIRDRALLPKLNCETLYRILEVYYENIADVYDGHIMEEYDENNDTYRKRVDILSKFLESISFIKLAFMEKLAREKKNELLEEFIYAVKQSCVAQKS
ncbi:hypothetical protein PAPHI01_1617 [Pancytospora philotis]|nr:hypothetical protein PAPHI01_1617 [Pancytospora philotis]